MIKGDILLISKQRKEDQKINIWDNIGKIIYRFRDNYNTEIRQVDKLNEKHNMIYVQFTNGFTLYFEEYERYYCALGYSKNSIEEFKDKFLFLETVAEELFGR